MSNTEKLVHSLQHLNNNNVMITIIVVIMIIIIVIILMLIIPILDSLEDLH